MEEDRIMPVIAVVLMLLFSIAYLIYNVYVLFISNEPIFINESDQTISTNIVSEEENI